MWDGMRPIASPEELLKALDVKNYFQIFLLNRTEESYFIAVLTVTVHSSFFPTFDFLKICCFLHWIQSVNPIFMLPYIIMDLPIL